jgi:hypothetical protein
MGIAIIAVVKSPVRRGQKRLIAIDTRTFVEVCC